MSIWLTAMSRSRAFKVRNGSPNVCVSSMVTVYVFPSHSGGFRFLAMLIATVAVSTRVGVPPSTANTRICWKSSRYVFIENYVPCKNIHSDCNVWFSFLKHRSYKFFIDVFQIIFDAKGLRPDMLRFPRFHWEVYSWTMTSQNKYINLYWKTGENIVCRVSVPLH